MTKSVEMKAINPVLPEVRRARGPSRHGTGGGAGGNGGGSRGGIGPAQRMSERPAARARVRTAAKLSGGSADRLLSVIEKAAVSRQIDAAKLKLLTDMHADLCRDQAKRAFVAALSDLQQKLPVFAENGEILMRNGATYSYALWEDINEILKPLLSEFGFVLTFRTGRYGEEVSVTGILAHKDGHSEETTITLPLDLGGQKNGAQAVGSSTSYGKRYAAAALLNLTSRGEDDDACGIDQEILITPEQKTELQSLIAHSGARPDLFLGYFNIADLDHLPAGEFDRAKAAIAARGAMS